MLKAIVSLRMLSKERTLQYMLAYEHGRSALLSLSMVGLSAQHSDLLDECKGHSTYPRIESLSIFAEHDLLAD